MKKLSTSLLVATIISVGLNIYQFVIHQQERNILTVSDMQKLHNFIHNVENYPSTAHAASTTDHVPTDAEERLHPPNGTDPGVPNAKASSASSAGTSTSNNFDPKEKAVELVKTYVAKNGKSTSNTKYEYDHMTGNSYIIHGYQDMGDHTATTGWYKVDVNTGKVQDVSDNPDAM